MSRARIDRIAAGLERILAVALIGAVALSFANVVGRYGLGVSLLSADELQVYIMICITFLGAAIVSWRNTHLRMDVLLAALPARVQAVIRGLEAIVTLVVLGFVTFQSFAYARRMLALGRESDMAHVPIWIPHGVVVVGFALMTLVVVWRAVAPGAATAAGGRKDVAGPEPRP